jgi:epoxyqueuosine reductase QueG
MSVKNNPERPKTVVDAALLRGLVSYARSLGCHDVGYTTVPRNLVYSGKSIAYPHAIVLTMPMDKTRIGKAPSMTSGREIWRIYDGLGQAVNKIARYLRKRGYGAQAGAALGGDVNYPLLAQMGGLGWIGKHGLLISPGTGPSQRIAAVFTTIENLPAAPMNPHSWIADFCSSCGKCVRACPAGAIYDVKPTMPDGGPQHIDHRKCAVPFSNTMGCSVCIKECTFFLGDYEKIKKASTG